MKVVTGSRASWILWRYLKKFSGGKKRFLIPANVCPVVPLTFLKAEVPFEFVDIHEEYFSMSIEDIGLKLREKPSDYQGIFWVRSYGRVSPMEETFLEWKKISPEIEILDDRCPSKPLLPDEIEATVADMMLFSTGYAKPVELGGGGYAYLQEEKELFTGTLSYKIEEENALMNLVREYQQSAKALPPQRYEWLGEKEGIHDRLDPYFQTIREKREANSRHREKMTAIYDEKLSSKFERANHVGHEWRYLLLVDDPGRYLKKIFKNELFASSHYRDVSKLFGFEPAPNADRIGKRMLNLFNDFRFTKEKALQVCEILNHEIGEK